VTLELPLVGAEPLPLAIDSGSHEGHMVREFMCERLYEVVRVRCC
jgi:hypothetical protein